jgi:hypothetical protein
MRIRETIAEMMRRLNYCIICGVLCIAATAFGRIGETEAQISARYGKPTQSLHSMKAYFYKDFFIIVAFDHSRSGVEIYQKRNSSPMTAVEIGTLLETNGGGTKWHQPIREGFEFYYKEKTRFAEYDALTNTLTVTEYGALNRINASSQLLDAKKMKGF